MTLRILHVEDSLADLELVADLFEALGADVQIERAVNGSEALEKLQRRARPDHAQRPDLVLLDLNLPLKSGHEVLQQLKADASLRSLPVVVLTTSRADADVSAAYDGGAAGYLVKAPSLDGMRRTVAAIKAYWIDQVALARPEGARMPALG